jgi:long-chain acyl-CoA synthetase
LERFHAAEVLHEISHHQATMFEGVPTMYSLMLSAPEVRSVDLSSLTRCTVGGQTISTATIDEWKERSGAEVIELWGMTELAGVGTTHALHAPKPAGSVGVALPGVQVRIADLDDVHKEVQAGQPGELMIRGPIVMLGYLNNEQATAETIEPDGWMHTGDIATMSETGHVTIVDRRKHMIITGGYNIYPAEIERVLAQHPAVQLVAAGPVPDAVFGEVPCAYIVRKPGAETSAEELLDFAGQRLPKYKRPRLLRFIDQIPMTSSGKIKRRELIQQFSAAVGHRGDEKAAS